MNCLLETFAFVNEHDESPVFCLESRPFVVTTYGVAPQKHALFPGVPLQLQSVTDLQFTLVMCPNTQTPRLVLFDPSLPGDTEE